MTGAQEILLKRQRESLEASKNLYVVTIVPQSFPLRLFFKITDQKGGGDNTSLAQTRMVHRKGGSRDQFPISFCVPNIYERTEVTMCKAFGQVASKSGHVENHTYAAQITFQLVTKSLECSQTLPHRAKGQGMRLG